MTPLQALVQQRLYQTAGYCLRARSSHPEQHNIVQPKAPQWVHLNRPVVDGARVDLFSRPQPELRPFPLGRGLGVDAAAYKTGLLSPFIADFIKFQGSDGSSIKLELNGW
ncbi:hypothetical protein HN018_22075 (plasmid) [Lichenicola cladoniae]|uniref:Uncharacterized protein n=1 Tax=Lichenicola cladoniae TaxID=1484109 RepID=A0A6M8HXI4_9PROT|nr:hypothetical protein [Lichenicola cladoniae]NPD69749.1 hypothetical protein [Acetobacteraceae bacterium]QKE92917.1 hypothetical protein HN018_22075 [Lichenicola cladoniae]